MKALHERGVYQKDIGLELGVHLKTVSRAITHGDSPARPCKPRASKLDSFKEQVDQLLSDGMWNAMVILREIQPQGYDGGITILRQYIVPMQPLRSGKVTVRFETKPGQQLQSDWGKIETDIAGEGVKVHFIVNQLAYSRHFHFPGLSVQDKLVH